MSLAIEIEKVTAVLLADGWHDVVNNSFELDAYEYMHGDHCLMGGGSVDGVPSTGFGFQEGPGAYLQGPITAVLAVRTRAG